MCFAHLGKHGDLCILLPGLRAVHDMMGVRPVCIVAEDFASIFDGVSYATPWPVRLNWWKELDKAKAMGEEKFGHCIVPKFWDIPGGKSPFEMTEDRPLRLKIHDRFITVPAKEWNSYQSAQWKAAGFPIEKMVEWPLVFDRRDAQRERLLRAQVFKTTQPKLLVNLYPGGSSPWRYGNLFQPLFEKPGFEVVNLANVKAHRIYDLLGLYDHAAGLVTSDTATLHLAAASSVPYVAFVNNGGSGSIPRGNCVLKVRYAEATKRANEVGQALREMVP